MAATLSLASQPSTPDISPMEYTLARLGEDMKDVKSVLSRLEPAIVRIDATMGTTIPHLATRAETGALRSELSERLASLPSKAFMWGMISALIAAYAAGLAALAVLK